jgi:hypothetical protein
MKKFFLLLLILLCGIHGFSFQPEDPEGKPAKTRRFSAGVNYFFMSVDMELSAMKLHSVWFGTEAGTEEKTQDQLDEINGYVDRNSRIQALVFQLGMTFLDRPDVKWKLKGAVFGGVAENRTTVTNKENDVKEYTFNSGFSRPCAGLVFDLGYQINPTWGVVLRPFVTGTLGSSSTIEDLVNPDLLNYNVSKENKYRTLYGKVSLLASFTTGKFSVFAGPGFYRIWSHHEYKRVYSQVDESDEISEEMTTDLVSKNFVDGNLAAAWRISERFTIDALFGFGGDVHMNAGLHYNF